MANEEEDRIKSLTGSGGADVDFSVKFTSQEVGKIDEMLLAYGPSRIGIVFKAISLLYTIYKEDPEAEAIFLKRGNQTVTIPLK